jgi:hypothetical protein
MVWYLRWNRQTRQRCSGTVRRVRYWWTSTFPCHGPQLRTCDHRGQTCCQTSRKKTRNRDGCCDADELVERKTPMHNRSVAPYIYSHQANDSCDNYMLSHWPNPLSRPRETVFSGGRGDHLKSWGTIREAVRIWELSLPQIMTPFLRIDCRRLHACFATPSLRA